MIPYRNTHLVVVVVEYVHLYSARQLDGVLRGDVAAAVRATVFKKAQGSVVSNRIGMKFGVIVPQVNTHR